MRKIVAEEGHYVYGYLRSNDSKTGLAGSPYYVGIANNIQRPFKRHARGTSNKGEQDVPVPKDEQLIRVLFICSSREEAIQREVQLVAHYGRKGIDTNGILLNRTLGGEGVLGLTHSNEMLERMRHPDWTERLKDAQRERSEKLAAMYGISISRWNTASTTAKSRAYARYQQGIRGEELLSPPQDISAIAAAKFGLDEEEYKGFDYKQRQIISVRHGLGYRGEELTIGVKEGVSVQIAKRAKEIGVDIQDLADLNKQDRMTVYNRFNNGARGEKLFEYLGEGDRAREMRKADELGISHETWMLFSRTQRNAIRSRHESGYRGDDLTEGITEGLSITIVKNAQSVGISPTKYAALTPRERATVLKRYRAGQRGEILLENLHGSGTKSIDAAMKYGLSTEIYENLSKSQKSNLRQRYRRGARGGDLYKDLAIPGH